MYVAGGVTTTGDEVMVLTVEVASQGQLVMVMVWPVSVAVYSWPLYVMVVG